MSATLGLANGAADPLTRSLVDAVEAAWREDGGDVRRVACAADEAAVDVLLAIGLPRYYRDLLAGPRTAFRIAWVGEPLPRLRNDGPPRAIERLGAAGILRIVRSAARPLRALPLPERASWLRASLGEERERAANLVEVIDCARRVDRLVTTSRDRAAVLAAHGVAARVVPWGQHPVFAGPLTSAAAGPRDLPILLLGSAVRRGRGRRSVTVRQLGYDRAPDLTVAGDVWGSDRDALLRRTRVLLDIHRAEGNFVGLRLLLATAAGAAMVTEPMTDPYPFEPGRHFVSAPAARLLSEARALTTDERRRREIVDNAQALCAAELTMGRSLERVLAA
jgi:hypothetical protein